MLTRIKMKLSGIIGRAATDEDAKAFLHHCEFSYKKENRLIPIHEHQQEYESYVNEKMHALGRLKFSVYLQEYRTYKRHQKIKNEAAAYFEKTILPMLKKFTTQREVGYHGLEHTELVGLRAIDIAVEQGYSNMQNELLPVMLAAALHDSARTNDAYNNTHGPDAANRYETTAFLNSPVFALTETQKQQIKNAVAHHTDAMPSLFKRHDFVTKCLCDADRVRLSWERGHDTRFFFTKTGDELGTMNPYRVQDYLFSWAYQFKKNDIPHIGRPLEARYRICYNPKIGHKCVAFNKPDSYGFNSYTRK